MILPQIQGYVQAQGRVSLAQLEVHFQIEAEALRGMVDQLVRRGRLRRLSSTSTCHGCADCAPATLEFYERSAQG